MQETEFKIRITLKQYLLMGKTNAIPDLQLKWKGVWATVTA